MRLKRVRWMHLTRNLYPSLVTLLTYLQKHGTSNQYQKMTMNELATYETSIFDNEEETYSIPHDN